MADQLKLKAELREEVGTSKSVQLRKKGKLPGIMYGHGEDAVAIALDYHDFNEGLHHGHRLFDIEVGGKSQTLLVKDLQYDYLGKDIIHADLVRVNLAEVVTVSVALEIKGTAPGTDEGGILDVHLDQIEIDCKVSDIPESLEVNVKELNIGESIYAGDVELPENMTLVTDPEALIVNCHYVTEAKTTEELEEEMPAGPEVISEKPEEEEESEGE